MVSKQANMTAIRRRYATRSRFCCNSRGLKPTATFVVSLRETGRNVQTPAPGKMASVTLNRYQFGEGESRSVGRRIQPRWKLREAGLPVPSRVGNGFSAFDECLPLPARNERGAGSGSTAIELRELRQDRSADFSPLPSILSGLEGCGLKSALLNSMAVGRGDKQRTTL